jgi:hypothetical protein
MTRYERLRARLCRSCPIKKTCPQFEEQLDACADAELIQIEEGPELPVAAPRRSRKDL